MTPSEIMAVIDAKQPKRSIADDDLAEMYEELVEARNGYNKLS